MTDDDDLHPYYRRKARKNAEMVDFLVRRGWIFFAVMFLVAYAFS